MNVVYLLTAAALIVFNVLGLALAMRRYCSSHELARVAGVLGIGSLLFFVEHFAGLGRLDWVWPFATATSVATIYRHRHTLPDLWKSEYAFVLAFCYALIWRLAYPDVDLTSERLTDLYFISNYFAGDTLPPPDRWLPPYHFNFYYAFQHYCAALLGRIFGFTIGVTYNFAFCLLVALVLATLHAVVRRLCTTRRARVLVMIALLVGGNGISPFVRLFLEESAVPAPTGTLTVAEPESTWHKLGRVIGAPLGPKLTLWSSARFIGVFDREANTPLGKAWFDEEATSAPVGAPPQVLPMEPLSYLVFLGDYHPPLGGFLLLATALLCIVHLERNVEDRMALALLGATLPLTMITNAWIFPLHLAMSCAWLVYRRAHHQTAGWKIALAGAGVGLLLTFPFLSRFYGHGLTLPIAWVGRDLHTPWRQFALMHWPLLLLLATSATLWRRQRLAPMLAALWGGLLLLSEFVYVNDIYSGEFERFNTTLKWWSWIHTGAIATVLGLSLESPVKAARWAAVALTLLLSSYAPDLMRYLLFSPHPSVARFEGHYWLTRAPGNRELLGYLSAASPGIVLERIPAGAYSASSAFSLFSGHSALLGWPDHEWTWRNQPADVLLRASQVRDFYRGTLDDKPDWLAQNDVRYVVWSGSDNVIPGAFEAISREISGAYHWREFHRSGDYRVGIWEKRSQYCARSC